MRPLKIGIIAGEASGDHLGADLICELRKSYEGEITIVGVGGDLLKSQGLDSIFPMGEISLMGLASVLKKLPKLLYYIYKTIYYFAKENVDCLIIIDSPDFTHRVAKKLKKIKPKTAVLQYVAPSVWAWRPERALKIKAYIDELLAILPFEPEVFKKLNGPKTTYVGHSLLSNKYIKEIYSYKTDAPPANLLLLPGSRLSEINKLLPVFCETANLLQKNNKFQLYIVTLPHLVANIKSTIKDFPCEIISKEEEKWKLYAKANVALAASGTISLELALCKIPMILAYKLDFFANYFIKPRIKTWSAALPNLIVDEAFIPEFYNEYAKANILAKHLERLLKNETARQLQLEAFASIQKIMHTKQSAGSLAAHRVLKLLGL